jgi:prefoldin subunit 5
MVSFRVPLLVFLAPVALQGEKTSVTVTPIQKVLQLMDDMIAKGTKEKQTEEVKFASFNEWCGNTQRIKTDEIAAGVDRMEELTASIDKSGVKIKKLTERIQELDEDVGRWESDKKAATDVRTKEETDFSATVTDYSESLDALDGAIEVLKKQAYARNQAELVQTLLQVGRQKLVSNKIKDALMSFLQLQQPDVKEMPDDKMSYQAPEAAGYEFQSGGVVDMLLKLKDEFEEKKGKLMKEHTDAKNAYGLIMQQLTGNVDNADHEIKKKKVLRAETEQAKAEAEGDLAATTKERDEDQVYLDETKAMCNQKADDFEARQKLRAEELEVLKKAMEIIADGTVKGAGEKNLPQLLQMGAKRRLAMAQAKAKQMNPLQTQIAAFLSARAQATGSRLLSQASQQVIANPFNKVKKMIKDLIVQLMEEATAETEHKGWCDTELTTNKMTRDAKTADVASLASQIEDLTATIADLTQNLADLATEIKELEDAMAKATSDRIAAKGANEQTIKEAKLAQTAVSNAMALVKDFYEKSAQATALAQQSPAEEAPETFSKPYKGMLPEGGNLVDFLEVILTDFTRLETETTDDEAAEKSRYDEFMAEAEKNKALKENEAKHKDGTKTDKESALHAAEAELKTTQEQLAAAVAYYEKLKPSCVDSGVSYEERVKRREEEIQSLQEALKVLQGQDFNA